MEAPKIVMLFQNGNVACFDDNGQQIAELQQKGWFETWFEWLETKGVNPLDIAEIRANVNGNDVLIKPFKTENGWSYTIEDKT